MLYRIINTISIKTEIAIGLLQEIRKPIGRLVWWLYVSRLVISSDHQTSSVNIYYVHRITDNQSQQVQRYTIYSREDRLKQGLKHQAKPHHTTLLFSSLTSVIIFEHRFSSWAYQSILLTANNLFYLINCYFISSLPSSKLRDKLSSQ